MSRYRGGALALLGATAGVALGFFAATSWRPGVEPGVVGADLTVGWTYIGGGVAVWAMRRNNFIGRLLIGVGVAWFAGTLWPSLEFLHRGPLFHVLVTYPTGRLAGRADGVGRVLTIAVLFGYGANVTRLGGSPAVASAYGALVLLSAVAALSGASGTLRRTRLAGVAASMAIGAVVLAGPIARMGGVPLGLPGLYGYEVVLAIAALVMALDLLLNAWAQAAAAQVVVDLGDAALVGTIQERLARSLGDPTLVVGYALDDAPMTFVDELGQPVSMPPPAAGRTVAPMLVGGREVGFIAGETVVLDDKRLVDAVSAAAGLARSNSLLQAQVRARVAEVAASRERLVHAADAERRRLEQRVRMGAGHHLERVSAILEQLHPADRAANGAATDLREELVLARAELADFARGIHPAALTDAGLGAALADVVQRSPTTTRLEFSVAAADPITTATIYFICSEAITNAAKHAGATMVSIDVRQVGDTIQLRVTDNGRGGATLAPRGGLRGLADRVEALGGSFQLQSELGMGTTLCVEMVASR